MSDLTPKDRERISQLETLLNRVRRANALVEQFAASPRDAERLVVTLRRLFNQLKMQFTSAGFDRIALMCGGLEQTARRGMSHAPKARSLRDGLGNVLRQMEVEKRGILSATPRRERESE